MPPGENVKFDYTITQRVKSTRNGKISYISGSWNFDLTLEVKLEYK
jgi:hypothetical protein